MASPEAKPAGDSRPDGTGIRVGIVRARWNAEIVDALVEGAGRAIAATGASSVEATVPGAFELPFAASVLARSGDVDAVVVLGCVIRGETTHYEIVSEGCARGVMRVQLDTGVPVGLGIVTVEDHDQALARSEGEGGHNVGEDATFAAVEMAVLARSTLR